MIVRSRVKSDSRVLRIGDAIAAAGHDVACVGYASTGEAPAWPLVEVPGNSLAGLQRATQAAMLPLARVKRGWRVAYWRDHRVLDLYDQALALRPDVVHAHDWDTLPIAARLADEIGSRIVYDSHEFAVEEHADSRTWRMLFAPFTRAIESTFAPRADAVIAVSQSIAEELRALYDLPVTPTVIRNIPDGDRYAPRSVGESVRVLYHGGVTRNRGLVEASASTHLWPEHYSLTIRGSVDDELRREIMAAGSPGRVTVVDPVPPSQVVVEANPFDIGIHPCLGTGKQDEYSLPNKFFEYMNAGLALCITDYRDMGDLIRANALGTLIEKPVTPASIAKAIIDLSPERIWEAKLASQRFAAVTRWSNEATTLAELYEKLPRR